MKLLKKPVVILSVITAFTLASLIYIWNLTCNAEPRYLAERQTVAASVLMQSKDVPEYPVKLTGFLANRPSLVIKKNASHVYEFLPIQSEALDADDEQRTLFAYVQRHKDAASISELIDADGLHGRLFQSIGDKRKEELQIAFPDLDLESTIVLSLHRVAPAWTKWVVVGFGVQSIFGLMLVIWSMRRRNQGDAEWETRIDEDRMPTYQKHTRAMRLIGSDSPALQSNLVARKIDTEFDVPDEEPRRPRMNRIAVRAIGFVGLVVFLGLAEYGLKSSGWITKFSQFTGIAILFGVMTAIQLLMTVFVHKRIRRSEKSIEEKDAEYRQSGFHRYHHAVLRELDFIELGDYKQVGVPALLTRTIYLSRGKNLLVEIGTDGGRSFFTLETLTNDGKLIETHSLLKHEGTKVLSNGRHIRQAAAHDDIIRALEEHDKLVEIHTCTGSVFEAEFTDEKFPRFLNWPSSSGKLSNEPQPAMISA